MVFGENEKSYQFDYSKQLSTRSSNLTMNHKIIIFACLVVALVVFTTGNNSLNSVVFVCKTKLTSLMYFSSGMCTAFQLSTLQMSILLMFVVFFLFFKVEAVNVPECDEVCARGEPTQNRNISECCRSRGYPNGGWCNRGDRGWCKWKLPLYKIFGTKINDFWTKKPRYCHRKMKNSFTCWKNEIIFLLCTQR